VRLGSLGDVIHALPAVASLKHSLPRAHLAWLIEPRWAPLVAGNPFVDELILFDRSRLRNWIELWRRLGAARFDTVVDFQGLIKSALPALMARPERIFGFHASQVRERAAALAYSHRVLARSAHVVERNLELAAAAGASFSLKVFPLPEGRPEGSLPEGDFILASPLGGWAAKQWPLDYYGELARLLEQGPRLRLVLNAAPHQAAALAGIDGVHLHLSALEGLIWATRRAAAVVGIDSGPLHLAAALAKPGVAIFGPTDPQRNGPYGGSMTVLRSPAARTSYKRRSRLEASMKDITPERVFDELMARLALVARRPGGA